MEPTTVPVDIARAPEEVARGVFAAINDHDLDGIESYLHPDDIQNFVPVGVFNGRPEVLGFFAGLFRALPDLTMTVEHVMSNE